MTRYQLQKCVREQGESDAEVWVAPVPQGPILRLDGAGGAIIALLHEADRPMGVAEIVTAFGEAEDLPADADAQVRTFLESVMEYGLVVAVGTGPDDPEDSDTAVVVSPA
ncbi:MAG: hypothetical protein Q4G40_11170 [Brachybacterium sp.]|nr:hypothetical protein [Brachybacterium sp.]